MASIELSHKIQSNESDANLLTRLAEEHDAFATIKNDRLLFLIAGVGKYASGAAIPTQTITRKDGEQHRYTMAEREKYTGVKAYWYDVNKAKKVWELVGTKDKTHSLKKAFVDKAQAKKAAAAELKRLNRGVAGFTMHLAFAMPHLFPETPVKADGFKPTIDNINWIIIRATHELGEGGFVTTLECEQKTD